MGEGGVVAIRDGTLNNLHLMWHGWLFDEGRPTRLGPRLWKAVDGEGLNRVEAEGLASLRPERAVDHEDSYPEATPWLYVLNPKHRCLALHVMVPPSALPHRVAHRLRLSEGGRGRVKVGSTWYFTSWEKRTFALVGAWDLSDHGPPDWGEVERRGGEVRGLRPEGVGEPPSSDERE